MKDIKLDRIVKALFGDMRGISKDENDAIDAYIRSIGENIEVECETGGIMKDVKTSSAL